MQEVLRSMKGATPTQLGMIFILDAACGFNTNSLKEAWTSAQDSLRKVDVANH